MASYIAPSGRGWSYAVTGDGSGKEPLILLHGWSLSGASFSPLSRLLADRFTIYTFDLPGHGASPTNDAVNVAALAEDIASFIELHIDQKPLLAGWSLGGQISLQLAACKHDCLAGLILLATTPKFVTADDWPHGQKASQVKFMIRGMERNAKATIEAFRKPIAEVAEYAAIYGEDPSYPDSRVAAELLQELIDVDLRELLSSINLPTLILHGKDDAVIPVAVADYMADQLQDANLLLVSGEHAPHLVDPSLVARSITTWFDEVICR